MPSYRIPCHRPFSSQVAPRKQESGYDRLLKRISSHPNPQQLFNKKKQQEAIDSGTIIDIHDVGGPDPDSYDVLITDMTNEDLRLGLSEVLGINYLQRATATEAIEVPESIQGVAYGPKQRPIFPGVVTRGNLSYWVFFIVTTSAPLTYISKEVSEIYLYNYY